MITSPTGGIPSIYIYIEDCKWLVTMGYDGCDCGLSADGMLIQTPHRVSRRFRSANLQRDAPTQANCNYSLLLVVNP